MAERVSEYKVKCKRCKCFIMILGDLPEFERIPNDNPKLCGFYAILLPGRACACHEEHQPITWYEVTKMDSGTSDILRKSGGVQ